MHTRPMDESEGVFREVWKPCSGFTCRKCGQARVEYRVWDSNCGGYEDTQYRCLACGRTWWVESADA